MKINIVMVEAEIPQNAGNVARTCACTGASLHFIRPLGFEVTDKHLKRAGLDYWNELDITYYDSLDEFFEKNKGGRFFFYSTKAKNRYDRVKYQENDFLLFGKESKGLPEKLLNDNYDHSVRIPMRADMRSLNLSNSICLAVYEVLRQDDFKSMTTEGNLTQY